MKALRRGKSARQEPDPGTRASGSLTETVGRLTTLSALFVGGFMLFKSYAVANFSLTTGSAILSTAPLSVLLGSLMSYAYWALPLVAVAATYKAARIVR